MQKKHSGISSKSGGNNGITTCEFLFRHVSVLTCGALYARHQTRVQNVDASKIPERKNAYCISVAVNFALLSGH